MEGDSAIVVHRLKELKGPSIRVNALLSDIRGWLSMLKFWQVSHIFSEGDVPADRIDDRGKLGLECYFVGAQILLELTDLLVRDLSDFVYKKE